MSRHLVSAFAGFLCVPLVMGCGGDDETADNPPSPPPAPPTEIAETDAQNDSAAPADGSATDTTPNNNEAEENNAADGFVAAGELAPYAKALSVVRPDHYAIVKFDLAAAREASLVQELPVDPDELATSAPIPREGREFAEMLTKVDEVWISIGPPAEGLVGSGAPPVQLGAYARFQDEAVLKETTAEFGAGEMVEATHSGVTYFAPKNPGAGPVFFTQGLDLFLSTDEDTIHQAIDAQGKLADAPLVKNLRSANLSSHMLVAGSLGPMREPATEMLKQLLTELPIPLAPTTADLPAQIDWGTIAINFEGETLIDIDLDMDKPENAMVMKETLNGLISLGKIMLQQQGANIGDDPTEKQAFALSQGLINAVKVEHGDAHVDVTLPYITELNELPKIMAGAQNSAVRAVRMNSAHMMGIAVKAYESDTGEKLTHITDDEGNAILSWRVALKDYVEGRDDVRGIKLDQPWNSEINKTFHESMPSFFALPGEKSEDDVPGVSPWKMLPDKPAGMLFILAGAGAEVPWMQPEKFTLDPNDPAASLGEEPEGGYVVAFDDGHVEVLTADTIKQRLADAGVTAPGDEDTRPEPAPETPVARTWTHAASGSTVEAELVKLEDGKVTLRRKDNGKEVTLAVDSLSAEDQEFLKSAAP